MADTVEVRRMVVSQKEIQASEFDSKPTPYRDLTRLNKLGIHFITLRRRSQKMLVEVARLRLRFG